MSSELLRVYCEHIGGQVRVHAIGEVDLATAPKLNQALGEAALTPGVRAVVANLTRVDFFSAAGLTVLLTATRRGEDDGVPVLVLTYQGQPVHRMITLAGLTGTLKLIDSLGQDGIQRQLVTRSVRAVANKQLSPGRF